MKIKIKAKKKNKTEKENHQIKSQVLRNYQILRKYYKFQNKQEKNKMWY